LEYYNPVTVELRPRVAKLVEESFSKLKSEKVAADEYGI
jgi:hypothetical protein